MKKRFDVAYVMAKQCQQITPLCQLEERHGVKLGEGYKNDMACATFVDYIAKDMRKNLAETLQGAHFFSIQMDGITDSANLEEEIFLAVYFDPFSSDGIIHVQNKILCVRQPTSVNALGLSECFDKGLAHLMILQVSTAPW